MSRHNSNGFQKTPKQRDRLRKRHYQTYHGTNGEKAPRPTVTPKELAKRYTEASDNGERLQVVYELETRGTSEALARSGAMYLDIAMQTEDGSRNAFLGQARHNMQQALLTEGTIFSCDSTARAAVLLAHMDIFEQLTPSQTSIDPDQLRKAHEQNLHVSQMIANSQRHYKEHDDAEQTSDFWGLAAEQAVLLLLERFSVKEVGDGSWFVRPAVFSEDMKFCKRGDPRTSFDILGLTQDDASYQFYPAYKIQVKAAHTAHTEYDYADEITTVIATRDLALQHDSGSAWVSPLKVIEECVFEHEAMLAQEQSVGDSAVTARLKQRTDQLLEILG